MRSNPYRDVVEFGVLGSLQILGPSGPIDVRGARERLLLAHLLAASGRPLPVSTLIDGLWGDDPPRTAGKALQNLVLRVRRAIEPDRSVGPQGDLAARGGQVGGAAGSTRAVARSCLQRADGRAPGRGRGPAQPTPTSRARLDFGDSGRG